jgi:hypothetical protein
MGRCVKYLIQTLATIMLMPVLSGCVASFQGDRLDPVSSYPTVKQQKSLFIKMAYSGKLNGEWWTKNDERNGAYLKKQCIDRLESSDFFSIVSDDLYTTDLQLYVAIVNKKKTSKARHAFSALTLFLIPYNSTDTFSLMAILKEPYTGKKVTIKLTDHVTHRQHLFMAPFTSFKSSGSEISTCTGRMLENLCIELHRTGMLE